MYAAFSTPIVRQFRTELSVVEKLSAREYARWVTAVKETYGTGSGSDTRMSGTASANSEDDSDASNAYSPGTYRQTHHFRFKRGDVRYDDLPVQMVPESNTIAKVSPPNPYCRTIPGHYRDLT